MSRSLFTRDRLILFVALLGVALLVASAWLVFMPAGLAVAGSSLVTVAYVARYLEVQSETS